MKYLVLLCLIVSIISCRNDENGKGKTFTTDSLPTQQFTISIDRDTTLQTSNGALLKIPKGAIVSENGTSVTLEIKEAYSIEQMIKGGLTTSANGEPLSSGGMIYINGTAGQQLKITQAIKVALPTDYFTEGMQLFKGDTSKGKINWTDPKPLQETEQMKAIANGRQIFQQNCSSCHGLGKSLSGPDLAHFRKRLEIDGESSNLSEFHSSQRLSVSISDTSRKDSTINLDGRHYHSNLYTCNLRRFWGGVIGPLFPELKVKDWNLIFNYIQTESERLNLPLPDHAYLTGCVDSCKLYSEAVRNLTEAKEKAKQKRKNLIDSNEAMVENQSWAPRIATSNEQPGPVSPPVYEEKVSPQNFGAQYYQFTIESFGWYNIDILLKDIPGIEQSELFVRIQGEYKERIDLYLIIPSLKANVRGGLTQREQDEYAFDAKDGKIRLPQGEKAYILAITESERSLAYALQAFNANKRQMISIELKTATREEFANAMSVFAAQGLKIGVQDAQNAGEIRKKDAELKSIDEQLKKAEDLKPKGCDCNCGTPAKPVTIAVPK